MMTRRGTVIVIMIRVIIMIIVMIMIRACRCAIGLARPRHRATDSGWQAAASDGCQGTVQVSGPRSTEYLPAASLSASDRRTRDSNHRDNTQADAAVPLTVRVGLRRSRRPRWDTELEY